MEFKKAWDKSRVADVDSLMLNVVNGAFCLFLSVNGGSMLNLVNSNTLELKRQGMKCLTDVIKTTKFEIIEHKLAVIILVMFNIAIFDDDFRMDNSNYIVQAKDLISPILKKNPEMLFFHFLQTQISRRLGDLVSSVHSARIVLTSFKLMSLDCWYMHFDLGCLLFVQKEFLKCKNELLIIHDCWEHKQGVVNLLISICCSMMHEEEEAVYFLQKIKAYDMVWGRKIDSFMFRQSPDLLFFDMCYFLNFTNWFNTDGATSDWVQSRIRELTRMNETAFDTRLLVMDAHEEFLSSSFLLGVFFKLARRDEEAKKCFMTVLKNPDNKASDQWHFSFAHYELAILDIKQKHLLSAKSNLIEAQIRTPDTSFQGILSSKITAASCYLKQHEEGFPSPSENDELGLFFPLDTDVKSFTSYTLNPNSRYVIEKPVKTGQIVSWMWNLDFGKTDFQVVFRGGAGLDQEIEHFRNVDALKLKNGFYVASEEGQLLFTWVNPHLYSQIQIHYGFSNVC
jgi:hypothetical protein